MHILENTSFSDDVVKNKKIKICLFDKFFLDVQKKFKSKFDEIDREDRFFYSISIKAYLENVILHMYWIGSFFSLEKYMLI